MQNELKGPSFFHSISALVSILDGVQDHSDPLGPEEKGHSSFLLPVFGFPTGFYSEMGWSVDSSSGRGLPWLRWANQLSHRCGIRFLYRITGSIGSISRKTTLNSQHCGLVSSAGLHSELRFHLFKKHRSKGLVRKRALSHDHFEEWP